MMSSRLILEEMGGPEKGIKKVDSFECMFGSYLGILIIYSERFTSIS